MPRVAHRSQGIVAKKEVSAIRQNLEVEVSLAFSLFVVSEAIDELLL